MLVDFTCVSSDNGEISYVQNAGGAPANVVCMASKLGASTGFIGKLGRDMFGEYLNNILQTHKVDTAGVITDPNFSSTLAFVKKNEEGQREYVFFRAPEISADINLSFEEINTDIIDECKIFHFGGLSLTDEPSRSATLKAVQYAKQHGKIISFDPNWRPALWKDKDEAVDIIRTAVRYADILRISEPELQLITDCGAFIHAAAELLGIGVKILCVTQGAKGCMIATSKGIERYPSYKTVIKDTLGAGDCFLGAFLYKLSGSGKSIDELDSDDIRDMAMFSNACGALSSSKKGAIPAMPTLAEINEIMNADDPQRI